MKLKMKFKFLSPVLALTTLLTMSAFPMLASAASFTAISDTMSTQAPSTAADHTLEWTLATGHTTAVNAVITIDFTQADFVTSGTWQTTDFAFTDNVRSAAAPAAVGTGAATCSGSSASNYIVNVTAATSTFVITTCTGWTTSAAATPTTFVIKGATGGTGTLTNQTDVNSSLYTIVNSVNDTDSGQGAIVVETNDVVTVTATVNPTLTFAISSATVALGTLSTGAASSGSHTISVGTNAGGGFEVTYNGPTLTSGGNTIAAYGALASSTPGTAGFGLNLKSNTVPSVGAAVVTNAGTCGIATNYNTANSYSYVASTTTPVTAVTAPADCVYTAAYVANISSVTPAGAYSAALTYVATGTF